MENAAQDLELTAVQVMLMNFPLAYGLPRTELSPQYEERFKKLKRRLAEMAVAAYRLEAFKEFLMQFNLAEELHWCRRVSEVTTLVKAVLPEDAATKKVLGREYWSQVADIYTNELRRRNVEDFTIGNMRDRLPKPPYQSAQEIEDSAPHDAEVDHFSDNEYDRVKDLSDGLAPNTSEWYLTDDTVKSLIPYGKGLSAEEWGPYNAALVMVSERHRKSDLVHLVSAALLHQPALTSDEVRFQYRTTTESIEGFTGWIDVYSEPDWLAIKEQAKTCTICRYEFRKVRVMYQVLEN